MIRKQFLLFCLLLLTTDMSAQDMTVTKFEHDQYDPTATSTKYMVKDGNDSICALILVKVPLKKVKFDGNVIKASPERKNGAYWVYVSPGTRFLEIIPSEDEKLNSLDYKFDGVKGGATYQLVIKLPSDEPPKSSFTVSAGFNVTPFLGPAVTLGFMFHNFTVEVGGAYGLNKSSDVYIYNKAGVLVDGYNYNALRGMLRVGYDFWPAPVFAVTPQVGAAINAIQGTRLNDIGSPAEKVLDGATAMSGTFGARLMFAPAGVTGPFRLFVTPEYDFALSKDKNFEALSAFDSKIKSWAEGFNVNLGVMFYF